MVECLSWDQGVTGPSLSSIVYLSIQYSWSSDQAICLCNIHFSSELRNLSNWWQNYFMIWYIFGVIKMILKMWLCCLLIKSSYSSSLPTKFDHGSKQYEPWPGSILYAILTTKENMQTWEQMIKLWPAGKGINALENEQIGICYTRDSLYKCIESPWSH